MNNNKRILNIQSYFSEILPKDLIFWWNEVQQIRDRHLQVNEDYGIVLLHQVYELSSNCDEIQVDQALTSLKGNLPSNLLALASDEGGNQIVISLRQNDYAKIFFWDHELNKVVLIANDLVELKNNLFTVTYDLSSLDMILERDDSFKLKNWIQTNSIVYKDEEGRNLMEQAAIQGSNKCVSLLFEENVDMGNSIELAKTNAMYFPEHKITLQLLIDLYRKGRDI